MVDLLDQVRVLSTCTGSIAAIACSLTQFHASRWYLVLVCTEYEVSTHIQVVHVTHGFTMYVPLTNRQLSEPSVIDDCEQYQYLGSTHTASRLTSRTLCTNNDTRQTSLTARPPQPVCLSRVAASRPVGRGPRVARLS